MATAALLLTGQVATTRAQATQALSARPTAAEVRVRIQATDAADSRIMATLHQITDVHGPRLTGSPQLRVAQDWAVRTLKDWGLQQVHLEPWYFGHQGWSNALMEASVVAPYQAPITARALPWSPSTKGLVVGNAVLLLPPGLAPVAARSAAASPDPTAGTPPSQAAAMPTRDELAAYRLGVSIRPLFRGDLRRGARL